MSEWGCVWVGYASMNFSSGDLSEWFFSSTLFPFTL